MKKLTIFIVLLCCIKGYSQDVDRSLNKWNFKIGVNLVDNRGISELFGGLTTVEANAFGKLPITASIERRMNNLFGIEAVASINSWSANTGVLDGIQLSNPEGYYALDVNAKLYLNELLNFSSDLSWLDIYAHAGLGRFTINQGTFTFNYGGGASIWLSDLIGLDFNTTIKSAFNESELYETGHFVYSAGLIFRLSKKKEPELPKKIIKLPLPKDFDRDGVIDAEDDCTDVFGFADNRGCPYPDTDKDGVIDKADDCPQIKGDPANNGCPVEKKVVEVVEVVEEPVADLVTVAKKIQFESGNYNFTQDTYPYLIDLAKILIQKPTSVQFKIVGHTDSTGSYEANRTLSLRRASAVRNYLVDSGISKGRIEIDGLGESDPIDTNLTEEGRANNRRVQIIIIK